MKKSKYVAIVDTKAGSHTPFFIVHLLSTFKAEAFAEGAIRGYDCPNAYTVYIAKRVGAKDCKVLAEVRKDGRIVTDSKWNGNINQVWKNFL